MILICCLVDGTRKMSFNVLVSPWLKMLWLATTLQLCHMDRYLLFLYYNAFISFSSDLKYLIVNFLTQVILWGSDQSGSGKTYTMWGPPSAMVDDPSPCSNQGIVPRVFQMLFSEIEKV